MIKAAQLQKGNIVRINAQPYQVKGVDVQTPSARGANTLYKVRFAGVPSGQKLEGTYKGTDSFEEMELERRPVSYIFREQELFTFMDMGTFEQYTLSEKSLEDQVLWLSEGMEGLTALLLNGTVSALELPASVDMEIVETAAAVRGATATNRNKPARLTNGVTVMVPEYLAPGDVIRVNTETGKFMSRVKE